MGHLVIDSLWFCDVFSSYIFAFSWMSEATVHFCHLSAVCCLFCLIVRTCSPCPSRVASFDAICKWVIRDFRSRRWSSSHKYFQSNVYFSIISSSWHSWTIAFMFCFDFLGETLDVSHKVSQMSTESLLLLLTAVVVSSSCINTTLAYFSDFS